MWHSCSLDSHNCLDLQQILQVFSAPITEEHAWALVHQVSQYLNTASQYRNVVNNFKYHLKENIDMGGYSEKYYYEFQFLKKRNVS